ncbi:MAG: GIY-YIG nuclease family protein [Pseudomonadota bacterium]
MPELSDEELLSALGVEVSPDQPVARNSREERIIAGFEDVQRFVSENGHPPRHGEDYDIFERLYAVRLDRLRQQPEYRELLGPVDHQGLLEVDQPAESLSPDVSDEELLSALGAGVEEGSLADLKHVRSVAEIRAAEEIAQRERCENFEEFQPLFERVQTELESGLRVSRTIRKNAGFLKTDIRKHGFFILGGQVLYVAELGDPITAPNGETDARLRVIYSNGTESNILLRSLQRALYKDETSRLISDSNAPGPLFSGEVEDDDRDSGTIYVLRSMSDLPIVQENRDLLHKVGVTGGSVERRIANAKNEATFLLADVEIVTTYRLLNIDRVKLENLIHKVLLPARLDIKIDDRFGRPFAPQEWFLVPVFAIDEVVERIKDGTINGFIYEPEQARLIARN